MGSRGCVPHQKSLTALSNSPYRAVAVPAILVMAPVYLASSTNTPPYGEGMRNEAVSMAESWLFSTTRMDSTTPRNLNTRVHVSQLHNSNSLTWSSIHGSPLSSGELDCVATVNNQGLREGQNLHWGCW